MSFGGSYVVRIADVSIGANRRTPKQETIKELAESIKSIGLLNPITITISHKLVAGLHRLEACRLLGWTDIPSKVIDEDDAEIAEIDENLIRNELVELERCDLLSRRKALYEEKYPATKPGTAQAVGMNKSVGNNVVAESATTFAKDTAAKTGIADRTIRENVQISRSITPEVKEMIRELPVADKKTELLQIAKMKPEQQMAIAEKLVDGAKGFVEARRQVTKDNVQETKPIDGKYRIVYADPPWNYGDKRDGNTTGAEDHYPSMTIEELCSMPIAESTEDNAALFLWVTSPLLEDSFQVIKAWGFKYKTSFVWDKIKHNMGHYNSVRHEFLLIAAKGSCTPDVSKLFDSVQSIERTDKHSEKPDEFRQIIDTLYTTGNKLELFSRKQVMGWTVWGNQA